MGEHANAGGLSRKHILEAIDDSLRRSGTDYVDLYQIHRHDPDTPIEETLEALHDVVKAGKARYIGASSMFAWQFARMSNTQRMHGWTPFVSMQNHYNLIYREEEREMNPFCVAERHRADSWSPLARGFLAGNRAARPQGRDAARRARRLRPRPLLHRCGLRRCGTRRRSRAAQRSAADSDCLAWILRQPGVAAPIVSVTKRDQLDQLIAATSVRDGRGCDRGGGAVSAAPSSWTRIALISGWPSTRSRCRLLVPLRTFRRCDRR